MHILLAQAVRSFREWRLNMLHNSWEKKKSYREFVMELLAFRSQAALAIAAPCSPMFRRAYDASSW
jgi:hypothetical protein